MIANPYANKPRALSRPCWTPPDQYPLPIDHPPAAGAVRERESDLQDRWEQCQGRTIAGPEGAYLVLEPGRRNGGPGPDYLAAEVIFPDGTLHRGDVELHLRQRGWREHGHQWDARYGRVILHVTADGSSQPVAVDQRRRVPTIALLPGPSNTIPCEITPQALKNFKAADEYLYLLARQRWWWRLADWRGRDSQSWQERLAGRLGTAPHRQRLPGLWDRLLPVASDIFAFISMANAALPGCNDSASQPGSLSGRINLLSALAWFYRHERPALSVWSLADLSKMAAQLEPAGWANPTRAFLIEVAGNWLFPLATATGPVDRFDDWYELPRGWYYGRCRRLVERLGLPHPRKFGQQQGLLEWERSLCRSRDCEACPVTGRILGS